MEKEIGSHLDFPEQTTCVIASEFHCSDMLGALVGSLTLNIHTCFLQDPETSRCDICHCP